MSANSLLLWMSARREGSWQQFRAAVEELHLIESENGEQADPEEEVIDQTAIPLYQVLRLNLQRLGHAEFFTGASGSDWRVTPPSLAAIQQPSGWLGVLVGARSPGVLRRLHGAISPPKLETASSPACPDQIRIVAKDLETLVDIGNRAGLLVQSNAPHAILISLPAVDEPGMIRPFDLPVGADWKLERFSVSELRWKSSSREQVASSSGGLFRFSFRYQRHILFCAKGFTYRVPGQVGKYLALKQGKRRHGVLRYDASQRRFSLPASCRPPFLVERALVLCSGSLPSYEAVTSSTGLLQYTDVPEVVASLAARLLRQELR